LSPSAQPRIAVYREPQAPPVVIALPIPALPAHQGEPDGSSGTYQPGSPATPPGARVNPGPATTAGATIGAAATAADAGAGAATGVSVPRREGAVPFSIPHAIELLTTRAYSLARDLGGNIPLTVFRELVENLVHASFVGVVITILDGGNTLRVSDQGPGIPDKPAALRPGFTSASAEAKQFVRGVGSGFSIVSDMLAALGGELEIEDNLGRGTVVTARVPQAAESALAPGSAPAYTLNERQLKTLLLTVELAPVGPTRIAQELGVSTSTAYRDLVSLEHAGFVVCRPSGHRLATDGGLAYLQAVLTMR
jgi:hypothetical protein